VPTAEVYLLTQSPAFQPFSYTVPRRFRVAAGSLVAVPFRNGFDLGVVAKVEDGRAAGGRAATLKPILGMVAGPPVHPPFGKLLIFFSCLAMCSPSEMFALASFGNTGKRSTLTLYPTGGNAPPELRRELEVVRMMLPRKRTRVSAALVRKLLKSVGFNELLALIECGAFALEGRIGLGVQDVPPPKALRQRPLFPPGEAGIQLPPELAFSEQVTRALDAAAISPAKSYPVVCRRDDWRGFFSARTMADLLTRETGNRLVLVPTEWHVKRLLGEVPARLSERVLAFDTSMKAADFRRLGQMLAGPGPCMVVGRRSAQFLAMYAEIDEIIVFDPTAPPFRAEQYPRYDTFTNLLGLSRATGGQVTMLPLGPLPLGVWREALQSEVVALPADPGERIDRITGLVVEHASAGQQLLVYNNAVGGGQEVFCASCGEGMRCPQCSRRLVFASETHEVLCRGCGYRQRGAVCSTCGSRDLGVEVIGVVGLARRVRKLLQEAGNRPTPRVGPLDGARREKIRVPNLARTDVLIGTSTLLTPLEFYRPRTIIYVAQELLPRGRGSTPEASIVEEVARLRQLYGANAVRCVIAAPQAIAESIRTLLGAGGERAREELNGIRRQYRLPPYNVRVHFSLYGSKAKALGDFAEEMKGQLDFANRVIEWDISRITRTHRKGVLSLSGNVLLDRFSSRAFYDLRKRGKGKRIDLVYWPQYY